MAERVIGMMALETVKAERKGTSPKHLRRVSRILLFLNEDNKTNGSREWGEGARVVESVYYLGLLGTFFILFYFSRLEYYGGWCGGGDGGCRGCGG